MSEQNLIRSLLLGAGLCFLSAGVLFFKTGTPEVDENQHESILGYTQSGPINLGRQAGDESSGGGSGAEPEATPTPKPAAKLTEQEEKSVNDITKMLSVAIRKDLSTKSFLDIIKTSGLTPVASTMKNEETGTMTTVRASNALPGTRYFHAQFFGSDTLTDFPQHISFEIRPSGNSMAVATKMIEENFKGNLKREESRDGYNRWSTNNCQILWAQTLDLEATQDSPINPREPSDVGTVWVAVEHDIHCGDKSEH